MYDYEYEYETEATNTLFVIAVVVYIIAVLILAMMMQNVAKAKGYDGSTSDRQSHAVLLCLLFGLFGAIYIASLPDLILRDKFDKLIGGKDNNTNETVKPDEIDDTLPDYDKDVTTIESGDMLKADEDLSMVYDDDLKDTEEQKKQLSEYYDLLDELKSITIEDDLGSKAIEKSLDLIRESNIEKEELITYTNELKAAEKYLGRYHWTKGNSCLGETITIKLAFDDDYDGDDKQLKWERVFLVCEDEDAEYWCYFEPKDYSHLLYSYDDEELVFAITRNDSGSIFVSDGTDLAVFSPV